MKRSLGLVVMSATVIGLVGCAKPPEVRREWVTTRQDAESLDTARAECKRTAVESTAKIRVKGTAAKVGAVRFLECMRAKGWEMREVAE